MFLLYPEANQGVGYGKYGELPMAENACVLESLISSLRNMDPSAPPARGWKKIDSRDVEIGTLSPNMQQLWLLRERYFQELEDSAQKIEDLILVHDTEHEQLGDKMSVESCREHEKRVEELLEKMFAPRVIFGAVDDLFDAMIALQFPEDQDAGKSVTGIREGFKVVRRKDNARGDLHHPLKSLWKLIDEHRSTEAIAFLIELASKKPAEKSPSEEPPKS